MPESATLSVKVESDKAEGHALMLYDGECGVCNRTVRWVIARDHADHFRFAPQHSPLAAAILDRHGIDREATLRSNSVYLVLNTGSDHEQLLTQSDVSVKLLLLLGGRFRILGYLLRAIPAFLRNAAYRLFARNRYKVSGRYQVCPLPADSERNKFLF
jgi:predicted DCC family thiol-disulfide oxidoreductase YuxK